MIFDLMADRIEAWSPRLIPVVDSATLIRLDGIPHHFLAKSASAAGLHRMSRRMGSSSRP